MSEIKLTKAQQRALKDLQKPVFFVYHEPSHSRLIELGFARVEVKQESPYSPASYKRVIITESGLAYCKKHFTTTEQP